VNYREKLKAAIESINSKPEFSNIDPELGPSSIFQGVLTGRLEGLHLALSLLNNDEARIMPKDVVYPIESLSATLLANARGALERARHEAYPGSEDQIRGYARGLQEAGERLQALLTELSFGGDAA
jgi:hypothetical protein